MDSPVAVRPGLLRGLVRRRWLSVLVLTVLGAGAGAAAGTVLPTTYTATSGLFLEPLAGNPFSPVTATTRNEQIAALETEVALLSTTEVAEAARERVPELPVDARTHVAASVPSNSQVVEIAYTADTPGLAQLGADAFATAFLAYRVERADRVRGDEASALDQQLADTAELLDSATDRLSETEEGTAGEVQLQQQVQLYASQLSELQVQRLALDSTTPLPGEVITPAVVPVAPDGLPVTLLVLAGLVVGALAGATLGVYREHRDPRVHTLEEVSQLGTGQVLATLDTARRGHADRGDGYRALGAALLANLHDDTGVVTLVGADPTTDCTAVAARLAEAMVLTGHRIVLVSDDPVLAAGRPLDRAVVAAVAVGADLEAGVDRLGVEVRPGLRVVSVAGNRPDGAAGGTDDLLQHPRTALLLRALADSGHVVLVAAPPLPRGAGLSLAGLADQVVLLVRVGATHFDDAAAGIDRLARIGAPLLGAVAQQGPVDPPTWSATSEATDAVPAGSARTAAASEHGPDVWADEEGAAATIDRALSRTAGPDHPHT
ncbi:hypothetical protein [Aquipuribacter sp. SD81]|uniref:hypothetical protein n=1 Tax=Aquipuribacter sp. SD81 TaxID=3127703 RepID=UPI0030196736